MFSSDLESAKTKYRMPKYAMEILSKIITKYRMQAEIGLVV
jgi:hypothetical protein